MRNITIIFYSFFLGFWSKQGPFEAILDENLVLAFVLFRKSFTQFLSFIQTYKEKYLYGTTVPRLNRNHVGKHT